LLSPNPSRKKHHPNAETPNQNAEAELLENFAIKVDKKRRHTSIVYNDWNHTSEPDRKAVNPIAINTMTAISHETENR
jgi:hypothetical protein